MPRLMTGDNIRLGHFHILSASPRSTQEGWKHVGVMNPDGAVNSKWGTFPVYKHGIEEVPDDYGSEVRFYRKPSQAEAISMFKEFSLIKGVPADEL